MSGRHLWGLQETGLTDGRKEIEAEQVAEIRKTFYQTCPSLQSVGLYSHFRSPAEFKHVVAMVTLNAP